MFKLFKRHKYKLPFMIIVIALVFFTLSMTMENGDLFIDLFALCLPVFLLCIVFIYSTDD